jgi:hypothetical protein
MDVPFAARLQGIERLQENGGARDETKICISQRGASEASFVSGYTDGMRAHRRRRGDVRERTDARVGFFLEVLAHEILIKSTFYF